jgi:hypothetical protein
MTISRWLQFPQIKIDIYVVILAFTRTRHATLWRDLFIQSGPRIFSFTNATVVFAEVLFLVWWFWFYSFYETIPTWIKVLE